MVLVPLEGWKWSGAEPSGSVVKLDLQCSPVVAKARRCIGAAEGDKATHEVEGVSLGKRGVHIPVHGKRDHMTDEGVVCQGIFVEMLCK